jgi:hypothetical protein
MQNDNLMDVKFAVLADYASITREGKLNVLGIFDIINAPSLPMGLPLFYVVVSYEVGSAEFDTTKNIEIVLCDEDGDRLMSLNQELHIGSPSIRGTLLTTNQIAGIVGCRFTKTGSYQFDILVNGDSKKTIPLRVNQVTRGGEGKV